MLWRTVGLEDTLNKASQFMDEIDLRMNGISVPGTYRARVFFGLLHLSLEHFGSIVLLSKSKLYGSAAALLRSQYEVTIRAIYFYECSNDEEISSIVTGKDPKPLRKMLDKLETSLGSGGNGLAGYYQNTKGFM